MKDLLLCVHLNFGNFTLSYFRLRQRIVLKCVLHVQHDYFSSFNQSDRLFSGMVVAVAVILAQAPYCVISLKWPYCWTHKPSNQESPLFQASLKNFMTNLFFRVWAYETLNWSFSLWKKTTTKTTTKKQKQKQQQ